MKPSAAIARAVLAVALASCSNVNPRDPVAPDFDHDIRPILIARCGSCHGDTSPAANWSASRFTDVVACLASSASAVDGGTPDGSAPDASAPATDASRLQSALARTDHASYLTPAERTALRDWLAHGAPASRGALHPPGFADPRSVQFHARVLRSTRWAAMLDPTRPDACGRCHEGAPTRPPGAVYAARNAPACTSCHTQAQGALACGTCHGSTNRPSPPRDPCLHPDQIPDAHSAHVLGGALGVGPLACATCHPARTADFTTSHGDGTVDVVFDPARAGTTASYDRATRTCTVACHNHGGARATPNWRDRTPMRCGDCHSAPPANHSPGPCNFCHHEANADGTALTRGPFHFNGRVDLGDGSGTCSACHGNGNGTEGWPTTGSHAAHRSPTGGAAVACGDCHTVPTAVNSPGHLDATPGAELHFSGRAVVRGAMPTYTAAAGCAAVACHGAELSGASTAALRWGDTSGEARRCGACHALPPGPPHTTATNCEASQCHGAEVTPSPTGPAITADGRALHQNGVIDVGGSTR